ncbi:jg7968 [Pararge aegeria aegeria]|uniref:Jg7968 protein n=1 Tax=Pararge aegeria aegeria TaxID=348720 RepID=A0A8S4SL54_9NEOP|nr:jg7968 [Pararge aegeria aegeria]
MKRLPTTYTKVGNLVACLEASHPVFISHVMIVAAIMGQCSVYWIPQSGSTPRQRTRKKSRPGAAGGAEGQEAHLDSGHVKKSQPGASLHDSWKFNPQGGSQVSNRSSYLASSNIKAGIEQF